MSRDSRLSGVLHVLLHMAHQSGPMTSESLAQVMKTNPVVLRRIMGGLRDKGFVRSEKGHGGGWTLACDLSMITLRDIYVALGSPALFAFGNRSDAPRCLVEQAVNATLDQVLCDAEQALLARLGEVTLAMLDAEVQSRGKKRKMTANAKNPHAC